MDRAGRYVLGLMDDDERERAERDLEVDAAFREAMLLIAERMNVFDRAVPRGAEPDTSQADQWRLLKDRIHALPQMQPADSQGKTLSALSPQASRILSGTPPVAASKQDDGREMAEKPQTFGRRKTDFFKQPASLRDPGYERVGLHSMPGRKAVVLAVALILAFALGYVAGRM